MVSAMAADARLAAVAVGQHGAFTRGQATAAGFGAAQIERRVRAAAWVRVFPRVYRHAAAPESNALRLWAAVAWAGPPCALSYASAAAIWRIRVAPAERPELIVPRSRAPRVDGVVVHRVTRIDDGDVVRVGMLPVTTPARTIVDLAAVLDDGDLEAILEAARHRRLVTVRALGRHLDEFGSRGRPGAARLRRLLATLS